MDSLRDILAYSRNFIQDTMEVLEVKMGTLASGYFDADKISCDDLSTGSTETFHDIQKKKDLGNISRNKNGLLETDIKKKTTNNGSSTVTDSITNEKTSNMYEMHRAEQHPDQTCHRFEPTIIENGRSKKSDGLEPDEKKLDFNHESKNVRITINDELAPNGNNYLLPAEKERKQSIVSQRIFENNGFYLNVSLPERKLSYTEAILQNEMENYGISSVLDMLDNEEKEGDDMNEMEMPNPGSIQHFERLFYPRIPCKNCASCYAQYEEEIFCDDY